MEEKTGTFLKNSMTYGAITAGALILLSLIVYVSTGRTNVGFLEHVVLISGIIVGTKTLRDKFEHGVISYSRALTSGLMISVFAGLIYSIYNYILYAIVDPSLVDQIFTEAEEALLERGVSPDEIETMVSLYKKMISPLTMAIAGIFSYGFLGLIFSLFTSAFLKKEGDPFANVPDEEDEETKQE